MKVSKLPYVEQYDERYRATYKSRVGRTTAEQLLSPQNSSFITLLKGRPR